MTREITTHLEDQLHAAICKALLIMNQSLDFAQSEDGIQVRTILRQVLLSEPEPIETGDRVHLEVKAIEYCECGHTLWVHGVYGTVLRVKFTGGIRSALCSTSRLPHADAVVHGPLVFCIPPTALESDAGEEDG